MARRIEKTEDEKKIRSRVLGPGPVSYASAFAGAILGSYCNPDKVGLVKYEEMLDTDETCFFGVEFMALAVASRLGEYTHENETIQEFIRDQFQRIQGDLHSVVVEMMRSVIWAGFALTEIICTEEDGRWQLFDLQPIHPGAVEFSLWTDDNLQRNKVKSVKFTAGPQGFAIALGEEYPMNKFMHLVVSSRFGNPYGVSFYRAVYQKYYLKKNFTAFWAKAMERFGTPLSDITIEGGLDATVLDADGNEITTAQYALNLLNSIKSGTGIVHDEKTILQLHWPERSFGDIFQSAVDECNKMIFRGLLMPSLIADNSKTGAYAQSKTHKDVFFLTLDYLRNKMVECLLEQLVRPLISWNFGEQDSWGDFQTDDFDPEMARVYAEVVREGTQQGYLSPERFEDVEYVREKLGYPGISMAEWKKRMEERATADAEAKTLADRLEKATAQNNDSNDNKNNDAGKNDKLPDDKLSMDLNGLMTVFAYEKQEK